MAHILLVDDDEDLRSAIQHVLEDEGHDVTTARHGVEALELLEEGEAPGVALVDLYMPVMDGKELIGKMRGDARFADIPIILLSAAAGMAPVEGATVLTKVGMRAALLKEIERLCGSRVTVI